MLTKSLGLVSDNVTYDLEDSVAEGQKSNARQALSAHLDALAEADLNSTRPPSPGSETAAAERPGRPRLHSIRQRPAGVPEIAVRINAVSTRHALEDLTALGGALDRGLVDTLVIPKVQGPADLKFVADAVRRLAPGRQQQQPDSDNSNPGLGPVKLLALIESARAVMDLREICAGVAAADDNAPLDGLIFAAEDFALDLSVTRTPSLREFLYARSAIVTASRAGGLASTIDLVCTSFQGTEGAARLAAECRDGRGLGFNGKQCIHPNQVSVVQWQFAPGKDEIAWAVRVLVADEKATRSGRGAFTLDGSMIDAPVVGKARALVEKAERCWLDVEGLREKWKDVEPEWNT